MKTLKYFVFVFLVLLNVSCSSDEDSSVSDNTNTITIGQSVYNLKSAIISNSINGVYISLVNKTESQIDSSFNGTTLQQFNSFSANIPSIALTETTYDLSDISYLDFVVDGDLIYGELENETTLFYKNGDNPDLEVISGSITLTNYTVDNIELTFEFERADGIQISGTYKGGFVFIENSDA